MSTQSRCVSLLSLALLIAAAPLLAAARTQVEERVAAPADGVVQISNVSGSVSVTGWDGNEVEVTGTLGEGVRELVVENRGDRTVIEVELPENGGDDSDAELVVQVPRRSRVEVEAVSADVTVHDVEGRVDVEAVSGNVKVTGGKSALSALSVETVSGNIELTAASTHVSAETVSGALRITGASGTVQATAVSGNIEISASDLRKVDLEVVSGDIQLTGNLTSQADVDVSSHSGEVELRLPASTSARIEVETYSGQIQNELGGAASPGDGRGGQELEFTLGSGDGSIEIETFSGNVSLIAR